MPRNPGSDHDPFVFQTEVGAIRWTGYRADDLQGFVVGLERVSGSSIYYHFFHSMYRRHFLAGGYVHDFARWALVSLSLPPLSERLAQIDPLDFVAVREARERLLDTTGNFLGGLGDWVPIRASAPFYFLQQDSVVFPTGFSVRTLDSFSRALARIGSASIYYHLIGAPLRLGRRDNDFSVWLDTIGERSLADRIRAMNLHRWPIPVIRKRLVETVRQAVREGREAR